MIFVATNIIVFTFFPLDNRPIVLSSLEGRFEVCLKAINNRIDRGVLRVMNADVLSVHSVNIDTVSRCMSTRASVPIVGRVYVKFRQRFAFHRRLNAGVHGINLFLSDCFFQQNPEAQVSRR